VLLPAGLAELLFQLRLQSNGYDGHVIQGNTGTG
jgi:hypothetical protein